MANDEHIRKLQAGADAWNTWRDKNPELEIDLSGLKFSSVLPGVDTRWLGPEYSLAGYNLQGVNLECADFGRTRNVPSDLNLEDVPCAWFDGQTPGVRNPLVRTTVCKDLCPWVLKPNQDALAALLEGAAAWKAWKDVHDQREHDLSGIRIAHEFRSAGVYARGEMVDLSGMDMRGVGMRGADFQATDISGSDFGGADLRCSRFKATLANEAQFKNADLRRAEVFLSKFNDADFTGARTDGADISISTFRRAKMPSLQLSNSGLGACDFSGAILRDSSLEGTDLSASNVVNADLESTSIWRARLFDESLEIEGVWPPIKSTECVHNLQSLLTRLNQMTDDASQYVDVRNTRMYFRGEKDVSFNMHPFVMRDAGWRESEHKLISELNIKRPDEIQESALFIKRMVVAQHFQLPTRLLDITRNPLVALYYAAEPAESQQDGVVHLFIAPREAIYPYDSDTVSVVANFTRLEPFERALLLTHPSIERPPPQSRKVVVNHHGGSFRRASIRLNHFVAQEKPYWEDRIDLKDLFRVLIVEPQQHFDRIRAHEGAFMLSGYHERLERWKVDDYTQHAAPYNHLRFIVPHDSKAKLRAQLRLVGITKETLKVDLESAAEAVSHAHRMEE